MIDVASRNPRSGYLPGFHEWPVSVEENSILKVRKGGCMQRTLQQSKGGWAFRNLSRGVYWGPSPTSMIRSILRSKMILELCVPFPRSPLLLH
jgi:hypothetical protein